MKRDVRFSFIIPHYDIPELLHRCVSSVPQRGHPVFIVDYESQGLESHPQRYPDLFHQSIQWIRALRYGSAGYAQNLGLDKAKEKWILFIDANDFNTGKLEEFLD